MFHPYLNRLKGDFPLSSSCAEGILSRPLGITYLIDLITSLKTLGIHFALQISTLKHDSGLNKRIVILIRKVSFCINSLRHLKSFLRYR